MAEISNINLDCICIILVAILGVMGVLIVGILLSVDWGIKRHERD